jgi:crotonobetainyl-CoA:carnitine CoA-transferase CaiB-like acyl-CoA transferase
MMDRQPPLHGVRILAISQFGAGPFGTMLLSDLGAEVIKIEDPASGGDVARYIPPGAAGADSLYFQSFNRGKKSVLLDLRLAEGRRVFEDLVGKSDAVFNNLRGDLPGKLGLTYDQLKELKPEIVTCSLSGFGRSGPRSAEPGYDALVQAYAGYMSLTGGQDDPPSKSGVSVIDFAGGLAAALALVSGLLDARRSSKGRDIDVGLLDTAVSMLAYLAAWKLNSDWSPERMENSSHQTIVPAQNFRTRDGWLSVFCAKEVFWQRLAQAMEMEHLLMDDRFKTFAGRHRNRNALLPVLEEKFTTKTTGEWVDLLKGAVPVAPVNSLEEALADSQVVARGMVVEVEHPVSGRLRQTASPFKTAGVGGSFTRAPALGEHTLEVLTDLLGYSVDRIEQIRASGAIG